MNFPRSTRAREIGYLKLADELLDIADEPVETAQDAARNRLRVDTRKWILARALPKIFGEKVSVGGADDPIKVEIETKDVNDLELARWMLNTMNSAAKLTAADPPGALTDGTGEDDSE